MSRLIPLLALATTLSANAGCLQRWVYVDLSSKPTGARVRSKGLPGAHAVKRGTTPAGHYLPCSVDAMNPTVQITPDHWSYVFTKAGHNDEEVFVERKSVAPLCADSRAEAKQKPYRVRATLLAVTTEKGLHNTVKISSTPPGATVVDERTGKALGTTPLTTTLVFYAPYNVPHRVRIERPGYVTLKRAIDARTFTQHVMLYRPGETPPVQPPPKKRQPTPAPARPAPARP